MIPHINGPRPFSLAFIKRDQFDPWINTLRPRQNCSHFADNILNASSWLKMQKCHLRLVPKVPFNSIPSLVQIMAWRQPGAKPLFEPIMIDLLMHICVTRPQWVHEWEMNDNNNNGPNGHLFYVSGNLMMRRGMLPIIMLHDGDLRIALHLVSFWILTIWGSGSHWGNHGRVA